MQCEGCGKPECGCACDFYGKEEDEYGEMEY